VPALEREGEMRYPSSIGYIATISGIIAATAPAHAAALNPEEAASYVGKSATVCGLIASGNYAPGAPAQPTFLDFSRPYPNETFSALILGNDRAKFGKPEVSLREKYVCITGEILLYEGKPQVILRDPRQLSDN
jgi:hypothetical protein